MLKRPSPTRSFLRICPIAHSSRDTLCKNRLHNQRHSYNKRHIKRSVNDQNLSQARPLPRSPPPPQTAPASQNLALRATVIHRINLRHFLQVAPELPEQFHVRLKIRHIERVQQLLIGQPCHVVERLTHHLQRLVVNKRWNAGGAVDGDDRTGVRQQCRQGKAPGLRCRSVYLWLLSSSWCCTSEKKALSISVAILTLRDAHPSHHQQHHCHLKNYPFVQK